MIQIIAFLGNPGGQYQKTRHNLAWLVLENTPQFQDLSWKSKFKGEYSHFSSRGGKQVLLKPGTFMNNSGESLTAALTFFRLKPAELLVVHDDIEIPFGRHQLRAGGGLSGHNGLRSIAGSVGTGDFFRLRLGVGRPARGDVASHVLGRFTPQEEAELSLLYPQTARLLTALADTPPETIPPELASGNIHGEEKK